MLHRSNPIQASTLLSGAVDLWIVRETLGHRKVVLRLSSNHEMSAFKALQRIFLPASDARPRPLDFRPPTGSPTSLAWVLAVLAPTEAFQWVRRRNLSRN
jgi:hypothetical protein